MIRGRICGTLHALEAIVRVAPEATIAEVLNALLTCADEDLRDAALARLSVDIPLPALLAALEAVERRNHEPYGDA